MPDYICTSYRFISLDLYLINKKGYSRLIRGVRWSVVRLSSGVPQLCPFQIFLIYSCKDKLSVENYFHSFHSSELLWFALFFVTKQDINIHHIKHIFESVNIDK